MHQIMICSESLHFRMTWRGDYIAPCINASIVNIDLQRHTFRSGCVDISVIQTRKIYEGLKSSNIAKT